MSDLQKNICDLMSIRKRVYQSHGRDWPNSATANYVRQTFGVGQLITEAVSMSEAPGVPRSHHVAGYLADEAQNFVKKIKPSRVRDCLRKFAQTYSIDRDTLNLIILDLAENKFIYKYSYDIDSVYGINRRGQMVAQR